MEKTLLKIFIESKIRRVHRYYNNTNPYEVSDSDWQTNCNCIRKSQIFPFVVFGGGSKKCQHKNWSQQHLHNESLNHATVLAQPETVQSKTVSHRMKNVCKSGACYSCCLGFFC